MRWDERRALLALLAELRIALGLVNAVDLKLRGAVQRVDADARQFDAAILRAAQAVETLRPRRVRRRSTGGGNA